MTQGHEDTKTGVIPAALGCKDEGNLLLPSGHALHAAQSRPPYRLLRPRHVQDRVPDCGFWQDHHCLVISLVFTMLF